MSLEAGEIEQKYHIPVVAAAGSNVVSFGIGANMTYNTGMPIRYVGVPFPFSGQPRSVLKGYIEGKDTVSGKPMMQAIVEALTLPLTDHGKNVRDSCRRPRRRRDCFRQPRKTICNACSRKTVGPTTTRSSSPRRNEWLRC